MIAVTGASGHLGHLIVKGLQAKGVDVIALVRSPAKVVDLGVPVREADYDRPETLVPALAGVDTLMLVSGNELGARARQHAAVIDAAKSAGVKRIVYTSLLHADNSGIGLAPEHKLTEDALAASGISTTILRNGWYIENYASAVGGALAQGVVAGSAGEGRISAAPRSEMAEAAVAVLTTPGHDGKVYEIAGDDGFTLAEFAAEISAQTGKTIPYTNMPEAAYAEALTGAGLPAQWAGFYASTDTEIAKGALENHSGDLGRLIGRKTASLKQMVASLLAA